MDFRRILMDAIGGEAPARPLFMPDLGLWFAWHSRRGTLPEGCGETAAEAAASLNCPAWTVRSPWRLEYEGVEVTREKSATERVVRYRTRSGVLTEKWAPGPDGDWWQKEYPVKDEEDLDAAEEIVAAMRYRLEPSAAPGAADPGGVDVIGVPRTPYSDLLHTLLGWSDGLMLMMTEEERLTALLGVLEEKRNGLVRELASGFPASLFWAPDNLDGQFVTPAAFARHLRASYLDTGELLRQSGGRLWVHIGGMCRHLLGPMADSRVDGVAGVAGPPQSDATLAEARQAAGPGMTLWGGIPQDYVMPMVDRALLRGSISEAREFARTDGRTIVGVADHVPVDAEWDRLREIADALNS
jgi:hypothetical protein